MNKKKYSDPSVEVVNVEAVNILASSVGITNSTTDLDAVLSREKAALDSYLEQYFQ